MKEVKKAVADKIAAEEIEAKKTVRKAARSAKVEKTTTKLKEIH